tara:strand:- start:505 stop:705 length:201 start_codon:yes stop_codon:yes gene_type:complete
MAPVSSPYAIFRASDWSSVVAQPIEKEKCICIEPKKYCQQKGMQKKKSGNTLKKVALLRHVQLAFA